ncbi:MAG: endospore germination permease [Thermincola sp.]|jgi:spore germination protein|nr:endospore germination permease [Thermincola sp.]MDT3704682.1 endospore germination permease [Thermincola sp.]
MKNNLRNANIDKIDQKAVTIVLFASIIEFELFVFAKEIVKFARQDAWISVLLGGFIAALTTYLMIKLASRFPKNTYFEYNKKIWGNTIAFIILALYLIYWAIYLSLLLQETVYTNKFFFLQKTPSFVTLLLLALAAAWLIPYGITAIVRFFQIMFPFMVLPMILIFAIGIRNIDFSQFQPILHGGVVPVLKGAVYFAGTLQGLEVILFLSPFLDDLKKSVKPAMFGVGLTVSLAFLLLVLGIGVLGVGNLEYSIFPGIDTISLLELPGFAVERFELFLTFPWIIGVFTTICIFLYLLSYGTSQLLNIKNPKIAVYILTIAVVCSVYLFPNFMVEEKIRGFYNYFTLFFVYLLPSFTLLLAIIRSKRGKYE